jgi:hypothetical protein
MEKHSIRKLEASVGLALSLGAIGAGGVALKAMYDTMPKKDDIANCNEPSRLSERETCFSDLQDRDSNAFILGLLGSGVMLAGGLGTTGLAETLIRIKREEQVAEVVPAS